MNADENKPKRKRYPLEKVFIVTESYAGKLELSEIFADLIYSEYRRRQEAERKNAQSKIQNHEEDEMK